ncbi:gamma-interferon-inducible lysosomal thiol reductase-like [Palaemon carinicauda]|uniref:gamma-interferon-inducible lysosomal thiol reductase-like n=1 Tax=Palaemon carinicauda TaxID=392227 RepID=UPI0035B5A93C
MFPLLLIASALVAATNAAEADPVKVGVYDEAFCPACRNFVETQLGPTYDQLKDIMDVHLNAYGWARDWPDGEGYIFDCQHGPEECDGNQILGCADKYVTDPDLQVAFFTCFMSQSYRVKRPWDDGEKCAGELGLDWETIKTCASSVEGQILHHEAGVEFNSLDPMPIGVPHITINGMGSDAAYYDLKGEVCNAYTGTKPPACN